MKKASLLALLAVPFLMQTLPADGKTTPPNKVCESLGGTWDAQKQQCIMPYRPRPNPPPYSTQGTGTRREVNPKFKGDKWNLKR